MPYPFELSFDEAKGKEAEFNPIWCIRIHQEGWVDSQGARIITAPKSAEDHIDLEIDFLISELNKIRQDIKHRYRE